MSTRVHSLPTVRIQVLGPTTMTIAPDTLYLTDGRSGLRRLAERSVDLVIADLCPQPALRSPNSKAKRPGPAKPSVASDPVALLNECRRVLKLFNGVFFLPKAHLPLYLAFAQRNGFAWELDFWEHGTVPGSETPSVSYIISIWERGVQFNAEHKAAFFEKVKRYARPEGHTGNGARRKPYQLIQEYVLQRSKPGDIVLDPCCGAGTVPLVCRDSARTFIAFEPNPRWHALASKSLGPILEDPATAPQLPLMYA